jgi:hypothetical protein
MRRFPSLVCWRREILRDSAGTLVTSQATGGFSTEGGAASKNGVVIEVKYHDFPVERAGLSGIAL